MMAATLSPSQNSDATTTEGSDSVASSLQRHGVCEPLMLQGIIVGGMRQAFKLSHEPTEAVLDTLKRGP
jgi:hypothetical protein